MNINPASSAIFKIAVLILLVTTVGLPAAYFVFDHTFVLSLMVIFVGVITFCGILMLPGSCDAEGVFDERRIRLAITASLFLIYVTYFGTAIFWKEVGKVSKLEESLFESITTLLAIVLPFYFGASVATEYFKQKAAEKSE